MPSRFATSAVFFPTVTSLDHPYCLELPCRIRLKYDVAFKHLHRKQQHLYNVKKNQKEKTAEITQCQHVLPKEAKKQLAAYAGI